jgi:hypothetical protein
MRIEDVQPAGSLEYYCSRKHWLDVYPPPIEQHLDQIVQAVKRTLGKQTDAAKGSVTTPTAARPAARSFGFPLGITIALSIVLTSAAFLYKRWNHDREVSPPVRTPTTVQPDDKQSAKDETPTAASRSARSKPTVTTQPATLEADSQTTMRFTSATNPTQVAPSTLPSPSTLAPQYPPPSTAPLAIKDHVGAADPSGAEANEIDSREIELHGVQVRVTIIRSAEGDKETVICRITVVDEGRTTLDLPRARFSSPQGRPLSSQTALSAAVIARGSAVTLRLRKPPAFEVTEISLDIPVQFPDGTTDRLPVRNLQLRR